MRPLRECERGRRRRRDEERVEAHARAYVMYERLPRQGGRGGGGREVGRRWDGGGREVGSWWEGGKDHTPMSQAGRGDTWGEPRCTSATLHLMRARAATGNATGKVNVFPQLETRDLSNFLHPDKGRYLWRRSGRLACRTRTSLRG